MKNKEDIEPQSTYHENDIKDTVSCFTTLRILTLTSEKNPFFNVFSDLLLLSLSLSLSAASFKTFFRAM